LHLGSQAKCAAVYWHCFCSFSEAEWLFLDLHGSISRQGILWKPWKKILPLSDILLNENWGLWNFNVYLNQRHLAFGLLMVTLALYLFMDWLEAGTAHEEKGILWIKNRIFSKEGWKSRNLDQALLMGMFLGLCAFWNGAAVIGGLLILCGFAIFSDGKAEQIFHNSRDSLILCQKSQINLRTHSTSNNKNL